MNINMLDKDDRIQHMNVDAIASKYDSNGEWFEIIINDGRNRVAVISGPPGTPPDPHIHADYNEWWINVGGKTQWQIGQYKPFIAGWGDVVIAPAGYCHDIRPKGTGPGLRIVATHPNSNHDVRGIAPSRLIPVEYELPMPNLIHTRYSWLKKMLGTDTDWKQPIVDDNRNLLQIIQSATKSKQSDQRIASGDEWFVVLEGTTAIETDRQSNLNLVTGDIVLVESGTKYRVQNTGNDTSTIALVNESS